MENYYCYSKKSNCMRDSKYLEIGILHLIFAKKFCNGEMLNFPSSPEGVNNNLNLHSFLPLLVMGPTNYREKIKWDLKFTSL